MTSSAVAAVVVVALFGGCAAASPTIRRMIPQWWHGTFNTLIPRGWLCGCGLWVVIYGFAFCMACWLVACLIAVSPIIGLVDLVIWLVTRNDPV